MQFQRSALCGVLVLLLAACGPCPQAARHFQLLGTVVTIDRPGLSLVIKGDAVPGFMAAMTMPYKVKNPAELNSLAAGDSITAVIVLQKNDYWLEKHPSHKEIQRTPGSGVGLTFSFLR